MGPPHPAWQHKTAVFRHAGNKATELLTQCIDKSPKWSFHGRPKDVVDQATTQGPIAVNDSGRYPSQPTYSFGPPGGPDRGDGGSRPNGSRGFGGRPNSAPPGPLYVPLNPTTPQFSFGTTKRGCPFPDVGKMVTPGPTAFSDPRYSRGPKFSMETRRSSSRNNDGPGPGGFVPKRPQGATFTPHWGRPNNRGGNDRDRDPGSKGGGGCGGSFIAGPSSMGTGLSYSMGARRDTEIGIGDGSGSRGKPAKRDLGPVFTQFGYNDFGRATH